MFVEMYPGPIEFTLIPLGANTRAATLVSIQTPAFDTLYGTGPALLLASIDATVMTAMVARPLQSRALEGTRADEDVHPADERVHFVALVREVAVITAGDAHIVDREGDRKESKKPPAPTVHGDICRNEDRRENRREPHEENIVPEYPWRALGCLLHRKSLSCSSQSYGSVQEKRHIIPDGFSLVQDQSDD